MMRADLILRKSGALGRIIPVMAAVLLALSAGTAVYGKGSREGKEPGRSGVINVGDLASYVPVKIAAAKGFFAEEFGKDAITVEVRNFQSGPPEIEALAARDLDFALLGAQPAVQGIANNIGIQILSGVVDGSEGNGIIVRTEAGINSPEDLKGKKVAVPVGTTAHLTLIRTLEKNGLSLDDVELLNLGAGDIPAAILTGAVSAAAAFEPGLTAAVAAGGGQIRKLGTAAGYVQLLSVIVGRDDFVKQYPDLTTRFLKVIKRAVVWYNENFEESLDILAAAVSIDKEVLRAPTLAMPPLLALSGPNKASILEVGQYLRQSGIISVNLTEAGVFNDRYAKEAGIYDGGKGY